ncbi:MAG: hypothetical protein HP497_14020 [Nitrospira sp.]|nr:hypothetical protein [Nitrospira sp.]
MRHYNSFQRIGLTVMLLAAGLLGGLMAPTPSEAGTPTLTLQVDDGTSVNILGVSTTCPNGYTQCYKVNYNAANAVGSNSRSYNVKLAPNTTDIAKLLINDTSSDKVALTGVQFVPTSGTSSWPNTETHVLKITWTNTFDASPNTAGSYVFALSSTGYLSAAAGTSPLYTQYDWIQFAGWGVFNPSHTDLNGGKGVEILNVAPLTTNLTPLTLPGISNQAAATTFTLSQVVTYPTFGCDADGTGSGTQCKPAITITMTVTVFGPDTLVLTNSGIGVGGGPCKLTPADEGVTQPSGNPIPCHASGKKKSQDEPIQTDITQDVNDSLNSAAGDGVTTAAVACKPEDNCPCADPYDPKCAGTIVHILDTTPDKSSNGQIFKFTASGPGITCPECAPLPYSITIDLAGTGSKTFTPLPALGGRNWVFRNGDFPKIGDGTKWYWDVDSILCESLLEPTETKQASKYDGFTTWEADTGSLKTTFRVITMKGGDTVTCTSHAHQKSVNSQ